MWPHPSAAVRQTEEGKPDGYTATALTQLKGYLTGLICHEVSLDLKANTSMKG